MELPVAPSSTSAASSSSLPPSDAGLGVSRPGAVALSAPSLGGDPALSPGQDRRLSSVDPAVLQCLQYDAVVRESAAAASSDKKMGQGRAVQRTWSFSLSPARADQMRQLIAREEATRAHAFQTALLEQGFYTYAVLVQAIVRNLSRVGRSHRRRPPQLVEYLRCLEQHRALCLGLLPPLENLDEPAHLQPFEPQPSEADPNGGVLARKFESPSRAAEPLQRQQSPGSLAFWLATSERSRPELPAGTSSGESLGAPAPAPGARVVEDPPDGLVAAKSDLGPSFADFPVAEASAAGLGRPAGQRDSDGVGADKTIPPRETTRETVAMRETMRETMPNLDDEQEERLGERAPDELALAADEAGHRATETRAPTTRASDSGAPPGAAPGSGAPAAAPPPPPLAPPPAATLPPPQGRAAEAAGEEDAVPAAPADSPGGPADPADPVAPADPAASADPAAPAGPVAPDAPPQPPPPSQQQQPAAAPSPAINGSDAAAAQAAAAAASAEPPLPAVPQLPAHFTLLLDPPNVTSHFCSPVPPSCFKVRGPTYLDDKVKIVPGPSALLLLGSDLVRNPTNIEHCCAGNGAGRLRQLRAACPRDILCINFQLPGRPGGISLVLWFGLTAEAKADPRFYPLWQKFFAGEQDAFRAARLKFIPHVEQGNFMMKKAAGNRPAILAKAMKMRWHRGPGYLEIDVDVNSSSTAVNLWGLVQSVAKGLVMDMGFVLEAQEREFLPEKLLATVRINKVNLVELPTLVEQDQHHTL